jgi:hypothetical protein
VNFQSIFINCNRKGFDTKVNSSYNKMGRDAVDEENLILCCAAGCANVAIYNDCDCYGCSGKVSLTIA